MNKTPGKRKIAVVGNLAHVGYLITKALRDRGENVDLYVTSKSEVMVPGQNPYLRYDIEPNQDWIRVMPTRPLISALIKGRKMIKDYDLVLAVTLSPAYVQFFNPNFLIVATGADINQFVFHKGIYNWLLRRAYDKTRHIFYMTAGLIDAVRRLDMEAKSTFIPHLADFAQYPEANEPIERTGPMRLFWPSSWTRIKAPRPFVEACSRLFDQGVSFHVTVTDTSDTPGLLDEERDMVQEFIRKYPDNVTLIPRMLNSHDLHMEYRKADLIVDQFHLGEPGLIDLEAMCLERPVLDYFKEKFAFQFDGEAPPVLNVHTADDMVKVLGDLAARPDFREYLTARGKESRAWVEKFHSMDAGAQRILNVIDAL